MKPGRLSEDGHLLYGYQNSNNIAVLNLFRNYNPIICAETQRFFFQK